MNLINIANYSENTFGKYSKMVNLEPSSVPRWKIVEWKGGFAVAVVIYFSSHFSYLCYKDYLSYNIYSRLQLKISLKWHI